MNQDSWNSYLYQIIFETGHWYGGVSTRKGDDPNDDGYFGSPITHRKYWNDVPYRKEVVALLESKNYRIGNVDATLCMEQPKINPHITAMQEILAPIMKISVEDISIKATTNEGLGYVGSENGVNAYAVALIERID